MDVAMLHDPNAGVNAPMTTAPAPSKPGRKRKAPEKSPRGAYGMGDTVWVLALPDGRDPATGLPLTGKGAAAAQAKAAASDSAEEERARAAVGGGAPVTSEADDWRMHVWWPAKVFPSYLASSRMVREKKLGRDLLVGFFGRSKDLHWLPSLNTVPFGGLLSIPVHQPHMPAWCRQDLAAAVKECREYYFVQGGLIQMDTSKKVRKGGKGGGRKKSAGAVVKGVVAERVSGRASKKIKSNLADTGTGHGGAQDDDFEDGEFDDLDEVDVNVLDEAAILEYWSALEDRAAAEKAAGERKVEFIVAARQQRPAGEGGPDHKEEGALHRPDKHAAPASGLDLEGGVELLVKYKDRPYRECHWLPRAQLEYAGGTRAKTRVAKWLQSWVVRDWNGDLSQDDYFSPAFLAVERIVTERMMVLPESMRQPETAEAGAGAGAEAGAGPAVKHLCYLVKWRSLGYSDCTWELAGNVGDDAALRRYERVNDIKAAKDAADRGPQVMPDPTTWNKFEGADIPKYKDGHVLREYQVEALNWLLFCWHYGRGSILADEMGLGKTAQAVTFLHALQYEYRQPGPFLVIGPLSTLPHWQREVEAWTDMNCVYYHGNSEAREVIRQHEIEYGVAKDKERQTQPNPKYKFNVMITTYEIINQDATFLSGIPWKCIVVDEAHRLKNRQSRLHETLARFKSRHRVLLTGTPIQNNMEELWTLLNFLDAERFKSQADFMRLYGAMETAEQVTDLQLVLKDYLLRRLKYDVEKSIPAKEETIIEVELTSIQKQYYRAILEKNRNFLKKGVKNAALPTLMNIVMELRKCCNYPYLINGVAEKIESELGTQAVEALGGSLISTGGKMVLIDKLLPKLHKGGHKVLIFSQMRMMLDLIGDYLQYRGYTFERLDGMIHGNDRQAAIDRFTTDPSRFVFLLSTRAGGVGINLTAADTVIIYDSDWNPQNDLQAQARCHRIGQKKEVKIYRLITRKTYEMTMFERADIKMGLDKAVLGGGGLDGRGNDLDGDKGGQDGMGKPKPPALKKNEVDALLKHGAYDLFREEEAGESEKLSARFCEEDIDEILEHSSRVVRHEELHTGEASSTFAKASFTSSAADAALDIEDPRFWEKLLPHSALEMLVRRLNAHGSAGEGSPPDFVSSAQGRDDFLASLSTVHKNLMHARQELFNALGAMPSAAIGLDEDEMKEEIATMESLCHSAACYTEFEESQKVTIAAMLEDIARRPKRVRKQVLAAGNSNAMMDEVDSAIREEEVAMHLKYAGYEHLDLNDLDDSGCPVFKPNVNYLNERAKLHKEMTHRKEEIARLTRKGVGLKDRLQGLHRKLADVIPLLLGGFEDGRDIGSAMASMLELLRKYAMTYTTVQTGATSATATVLAPAHALHLSKVYKDFMVGVLYIDVLYIQGLHGRCTIYRCTIYTRTSW
jgi:superfamily II DNA or RNA helicase